MVEAAEKEKESKVKTVEEIEKELLGEKLQKQQDAAEALSPNAQRALVELTEHYEKKIVDQEDSIFLEDVAIMIEVSPDDAKTVLEELFEAKFIAKTLKERSTFAESVRPNGRGIHEGKKLAPKVRAELRKKTAESGNSEARSSTPPVNPPTVTATRGRSSAQGTPNID